ncbi:hypothetical protein CNR22_18485 [Sphingobacteriaceae bacterium]|nr:hypothetical protein CNR22_18485 [Sphingobacteriaceae bacterium]
MQISIEIKGFKPGIKLTGLLHEQLEPLMQIDKDLVWARLKLTFEENVFYSELCLIFSDGKIALTLTSNNFYNILNDTVDLACYLLQEKRKGSVVKRNMQDRGFTLPNRMSFDFSSN